MAEYIDREEYCEKHCRCSNEYCDKESCPIWKAPTVNVEPKREPAVWVRYSTTMMECSRCGRHTARHRFEYCPHCGAPMRESEGGKSNV